MKGSGASGPTLNHVDRQVQEEKEGCMKKELGAGIKKGAMGGQGKWPVWGGRLPGGGNIWPEL
jgi:hypothetical protein